MKIKETMNEYIENSLDELKDLIRKICVIPAPSNHEQRRADFCMRWFKENGFLG